MSGDLTFDLSDDLGDPAGSVTIEDHANNPLSILQFDFDDDDSTPLDTFLVASSFDQSTATQDTVIAGGDGDDTLIGSAHNDILADNGGDDTLTGGAGDDTFFIGRGENSVIGGALVDGDLVDDGIDTIEFDLDGPSGGVTVNLEQGIATTAETSSLFAGAGGDLRVGSLSSVSSDGATSTIFGAVGGIAGIEGLAFDSVTGNAYALIVEENFSSGNFEPRIAEMSPDTGAVLQEYGLVFDNNNNQIEDMVDLATSPAGALYGLELTMIQALAPYSQSTFPADPWSRHPKLYREPYPILLPWPSEQMEPSMSPIGIPRLM